MLIDGDRIIDVERIYMQECIVFYRHNGFLPAGFRELLLDDR